MPLLTTCSALARRVDMSSPCSFTQNAGHSLSGAGVVWTAIICDIWDQA